jgi:hypothetical protein
MKKIIIILILVIVGILAWGQYSKKEDTESLAYRYSDQGITLKDTYEILFRKDIGLIDQALEYKILISEADHASIIKNIKESEYYNNDFNPDLIFNNYPESLFIIGYESQSSYHLDWYDPNKHISFYDQIFITISKDENILHILEIHS